MPDLISILDSCRDALTLKELIRQFGQGVIEIAPTRLKYLRWIMSEFDLFTDNEQARLYDKLIELHAGLTGQIYPFVNDPDQAFSLSWIIILALLGYGRLFINLKLKAIVGISPEDYIENLANPLTANAWSFDQVKLE